MKRILVVLSLILLVLISNAQRNYCQEQIKDIEYILDEKGYPVFSYSFLKDVIDTSFINLLQINSFKRYKINENLRFYCRSSYSFEDNKITIKFIVTDYLRNGYKEDIRECYPLIEKEKLTQAYRFNKMKNVLDIKFAFLKQQILEQHFNPKIVKPNSTNALIFVIDSAKTIDTISMPLKNVIFAFNDRISKLESKNTKVGYDLIKFHKQYSTGISVVGVGLASNIIGVGVLTGLENIELGGALMVGGSVLTIVGISIMVNAHYNIKLAGEHLKMRVSPNKVSVKINF